MKRRQNKNRIPATGRPGTQLNKAKPIHCQRGKQWLFRLTAISAVPCAFLVLLEISLRLFGFGHPSKFLLRVQRQDAVMLEQNNKFGWRFFGSRMARLPAPISIPESKSPGTTRIFVFGESAAYGDPQPEFGLSRMLQTMLSLRYPGQHFEVVNAAMTAVNSHVILPIARDCADANGDIWVIYMGNNEIVGPYGGGSIFGTRGLSLPLIRSALSFKSTRVGELLESIRERLQKPPPGKSEWGGLSMFLDQTLDAESPRLRDVYHNFASNLDDIVRTGKRRGVGVVLSTLAVNLKDCAPFASTHRPGLSIEQKEEWQRFYKTGIEAQNAGKPNDAAPFFDKAAQIDNTFAELRFRQACCAFTLGNHPEAQEQFRAARDLDTLRFRCDTELNAIIRKAASANQVLFADAEEALIQASPGGVPGTELFYDHVHLTFAGNYLLARAIMNQVEQMLQKSVKTTDDLKSPSEQECAERLGWSEWNRGNGAAEMLARIQDPPFTSQANHSEQLVRLRSQIEKIGTASEPQLISEARQICEAALAKAGTDPFLYGQLASLKQRQGDLTGAAEAGRKVTEWLPNHAEGWAKVGAIVAQGGKFDEAIDCFKRAYQLDPQDVFSRNNCARALARAGRKQEAIAEYRQLLAVKPRFGPAWLELGKILEETDKAEAERCYSLALSNPVHLSTELAELARFCESRGWFAAAATNYDEALKTQPSNPMLHIWAGQTLEKLQRRSEAAVHYATASRLAPEMPEARFLHGVALGWEGKVSGAAEEFKETIRLKPELQEARLNLGIALHRGGHDDEALEQFEEVLRQNPGNKVALQLRQELLNKVGSRETH